MSRSLFDQDLQIRTSTSYNDGVASVHDSTVAEGQTTLEGDLNVLRTLTKSLSGESNWHDAPDRTLKQVNDKQKQYDKHASDMENVASGTGSSSYAFDSAFKAISGHNNGDGDSVTDGIIVNATESSRILIKDYDTRNAVNDSSGNDVYGVLSFDTAIVEANDTSSQLSAYANMTGVVSGQVADNNVDVDSKHYIKIVDDTGGFYHIDVYEDATMAAGDLVAHTATYNSTGAKALVADNASGLGGTITVDAVLGIDSDIEITHGRFLLTWKSWIAGVETAYSFASSQDLEVSSVPISAKEMDIPWSVYRTGAFHDVSGISGNVTDDAVAVDGMTDLLSGSTTQGQVNAILDNLGSTVNGEGLSLVAIEDASGYFTGADGEAAFNELEAQIGGATSTTFNFTEANVLTDDEALYASLEKLDLKWGDLASTSASEGASIVGIQDSAGSFTATNVEAALAELYADFEDADTQKAVETNGSPISSGVSHTVPGSLSFTPAAGGLNMDVYFEGQMLYEGAGNDYTEDAGSPSTAIKFLFTIPANRQLSYLVRK